MSCSVCFYEGTLLNQHRLINDVMSLCCINVQTTDAQTTLHDVANLQVTNCQKIFCITLHERFSKHRPNEICITWHQCSRIQRSHDKLYITLLQRLSDQQSNGICITLHLRSNSVALREYQKTIHFFNGDNLRYFMFTPLCTKPFLKKGLP